MFKSLRVNLVKLLIDTNEALIFERRLRNLYNKLFNGKIQLIVDVGANKGQTIDFFIKMDPTCKIFAFEPNNTLYQQLITKYRTNSNIQILNLGISDQAGEKVFHENVFDYTSSFEELNPNSKYLQNKAKILGVTAETIIKDNYTVKVTTLSAFINENVKDTIDVLKIDTEGHEYSCLKGLFDMPLKYKIKYIQLESHNDDMYLNKTDPASIAQLLKENGFIPEASIKHGFGELDELIYRNIHI